MKNKVKCIVLAGGPSSGKSEGIEIIKNNFKKLGYKVIVIPELATEIRQNGLIHTDGIISKVDFQRIIFKLQLYKENLYKSIIKKNEDCSNIILLLDRGLLDAKIYLSDDEFKKLLDEHNLTEKDIIDRYDAVFHLESTANLGEDFYSNLNNKFRLSNSEQAKIQEEKSINVWSMHNNFHIIHVEKSFDQKIKKLEQKIINEIKK